MARSVWRLVAGTAAVVLALSTATFLLVHVAPGDAAQTAAVARAGGAADAELVERLRTQLGLDQPLAVQYWRWLSGAVQGDFGVSARTGRPVAAELGVRLPVTLSLGGAGAALGVVAGTAIGIAGALLRPGLRRGALRMGALLGASVPNFWLAYSWGSAHEGTPFGGQSLFRGGRRARRHPDRRPYRRPRGGAS
ncbi:MAG: hypothetical protein ACRDYA_17430 [Egibacteraceae bacterium]